MIVFIMLVTIISIGLVGILVVVVYACVTTKSLHNFCSSLLRREPTKIRYLSDEDYAERACADCGQDRGDDDRNSKELDSEFQKSIEFDHGDYVQQLTRSPCGSTSSSGSGSGSGSSGDGRTGSSEDSDSDKAMVDGYCEHHHHPYRQCQCTDREEDSDDHFDNYKQIYDANVIAMNTVHLTMPGMIV